MHNHPAPIVAEFDAECAETPVSRALWLRPANSSRPPRLAATSSGIMIRREGALPFGQRGFRERVPLQHWRLTPSSQKDGDSTPSLPASR